MRGNMSGAVLDRLDRRILDLLQEDGSLGAQQVADRIGLSKAPCWRRIQRLRAEGVIERIVALVNPKAVNVATTVFVTIKTGHHSAAWFEQFATAVAAIPEVIEVFRMSGDVDYLMRVVVPDIDTYDVVYKRLIGAVDCSDVSASFAMKTLKTTTVLPLDYARGE